MLVFLRLRGQALGAIVEGFARFGMNSVATCLGLPAPDCDIDIEGVEIDPNADATSLLGRHYSRTRAYERVEHDVPTPSDVADGIGDHEHRLDRRMRRE